MNTYISFTDLLLFVTMLTDVITLCYVVFHNKRK